MSAAFFNHFADPAKGRAISAGMQQSRSAGALLELRPGQSQSGDFGGFVSACPSSATFPLSLRLNSRATYTFP
jgi:hypothetical protein